MQVMYGLVDQASAARPSGGRACRAGGRAAGRSLPRPGRRRLPSIRRYVRPSVGRLAGCQSVHRLILHVIDLLAGGRRAGGSGGRDREPAKGQPRGRVPASLFPRRFPFAAVLVHGSGLYRERFGSTTLGMCSAQIGFVVSLPEHFSQFSKISWECLLRRHVTA